jgi:transcriptional regulator with XRE-family HTH domain
MTKLGTFLRSRREAKGLSTRALANLLGVSWGYISDIEHDRRIPSEAVLARFSKALGVDGRELRILSGRLTNVAERYLKSQPELLRLVHLTAEAGLSGKDLGKLMKAVKRLVEGGR